MMEPTFLFFMLFLMALAALGLVVGGVVAVIRAFVRRGEASRLSEDEAQALRRLMDLAEKLEGRIGNLETILLERGEAERERERHPR